MHGTKGLVGLLPADVVTKDVQVRQDTTQRGKKLPQQRQQDFPDAKWQVHSFLHWEFIETKLTRQLCLSVLPTSPAKGKNYRRLLTVRNLLLQISDFSEVIQSLHAVPEILTWR